MGHSGSLELGHTVLIADSHWSSSCLSLPVTPDTADSNLCRLMWTVPSNPVSSSANHVLLIRTFLEEKLGRVQWTVHKGEGKGAFAKRALYQNLPGGELQSTLR